MPPFFDGSNLQNDIPISKMTPGVTATGAEIIPLLQGGKNRTLTITQVTAAAAGSAAAAQATANTALTNAATAQTTANTAQTNLTNYEAAVASAANGSGADLVGGIGRVVSSIAALRALLKSGVGRAFVLAYYSGGSTGGGQYWYNSSDTTSSDNGGSIIVASDGGRWYLSTFNGEVTAEQFGVIGGGTNDDTTLLQAAITNATTAGFKKLLLTNPAGYKITSTIVQPYSLTVEGIRQVIHCDTITPGAGTPAWRVAYANWATNADRFHFRTPLVGLIFQGNAAPTDNVWTTNLYGVQIEAYHMVLSNVTCVGFDRNFTFAASTGVYTGWLCWEVKFHNCASLYGQHGLYADFSTAAGQSGAGIMWQGGVLGHNNYSIYNNCGEITLLDVASDTPYIAHVKDNITILSSNEIGFMHWINSRIEAYGAGAAGVPGITNSGVMRFKDPFFVERNTVDLIGTTNASGYTMIEGGTSRTSDGRYKWGGAGVMSVRGVRPLNDSIAAIFTQLNSRILNGDLNDGTTTGWAVATGTATLTNVSNAAFLLSGKALNIAATVFPCTVDTAQIELEQGLANILLWFRVTNGNASGITVSLKLFNRSGSLISSPSQGVGSGVTATAFAIKTRMFPNVAYAVLEVSLTAGQTSNVVIGDAYLEQW